MRRHCEAVDEVGDGQPILLAFHFPQLLRLEPCLSDQFVEIVDVPRRPEREQNSTTSRQVGLDLLEERGQGLAVLVGRGPLVEVVGTKPPEGGVEQDQVKPTGNILEEVALPDFDPPGNAVPFCVAFRAIDRDRIHIDRDPMVRFRGGDASVDTTPRAQVENPVRPPQPLPG